MRAITIRNIEDPIYEKMKVKSRQEGISLNKLVLKKLKTTFEEVSPIEYHDLDFFFGTWTKDEHRRLNKALRKNRVIEKELWNSK